VNEEALARWGLSRQNKHKKTNKHTIKRVLCCPVIESDAMH